MRLFPLAAWIAIGASVLAVSGCGGSESSAPTVTGVGGTATSATPEGAIPPELLGAWTTTLKEADLPADVPPERRPLKAAGQGLEP